MNLSFYLLALVGAMTDQQAYIARTVMKARGVPPWSVVVDAALADEVAFTQQDKLVTYVDAHRLTRTPNTFYNIMVHESSHLLGHQHFDGAPGMAYAVTMYANGTIFEDATRLSPYAA